VEQTQRDIADTSVFNPERTLASQIGDAIDYRDWFKGFGFVILAGSPRDNLH
jgi:hypothetical protein